MTTATTRPTCVAFHPRFMPRCCHAAPPPLAHWLPPKGMAATSNSRATCTADHLPPRGALDHHRLSRNSNCRARRAHKKKRKASDHKRGKVATPEPLSTDIAATAASAATLPRLPSSSAINREVSLNQNGIRRRDDATPQPGRRYLSARQRY